MKLIDVRTKDGSREFTRLARAECVVRTTLRNMVQRLEGTRIVNFRKDGCANAWLHFTYCGYDFSASDPDSDLDNEIVLVVRDPQCPDTMLFQIAWHCERLLESEHYPMTL